MKNNDLKNMNRQIRSIRKNIIKDVRMLAKDVKSLSHGNTLGIIRALNRYLLLGYKVNELIRSSLNYRPNNDIVTNYLVSSLFLHDSFKLLNKREVESLHFVTGPEVCGVKVLDKIIDLRLEKQSAVFARAESGSVREAMIYLSKYEYKLWGCFHIHPGFGAFATFPSSTDMTLDRLLTKGGYKCLGAIFSRDGYVRFFSSKKFRVNVYGEGVEKIDERIYRITEVD
jgi:hypothetical protein